MIAWLLLSALVAVCGVGAGVVVWLADLRRRPDLARAELDRGVDPLDLALLSGGPVRAVDTSTVDFVERGLVLADAGRLTVSDEVDTLLDTPMDSPGYDPPYDLPEAMVLVAVREDGAEGLDAVRRRVVAGDLRRRARRLARRGLMVTPQRRRWEPMIVAGPTLLGLFVCSMGLMSSGRLDDVEWPLSITILAWVPVTLLAALTSSRRPGFHGPDPRTRRGIDVVDAAAERLPLSASQAQRVALGGFGAMTDASLRADIRRNAVDSRWKLPRRAGGQPDINALLAIEAMDPGGSDGGGSSDGGGT